MGGSGATVRWYRHGAYPIPHPVDSSLEGLCPPSFAPALRGCSHPLAAGPAGPRTSVTGACAVGLIAIGVAVQVVLNQTITHETTPGSLLPVVIIAVGAFLFLVAFVGCCGACKENYCLMITFAVFLSLIMLVEVAVAIAGYVFRDKVESEFNKNFRQQMQNYLKDNNTALVLDGLQKEFGCCGANNYTDWENISGMAKDRVPDSCCVNITVGCGNDFKKSAIHTQGCVESIGVWLRKKILLVAAAALGIAFVEVLGIIFSCCLVKSIRSGYEVM